MNKLFSPMSREERIQESVRCHIIQQLEEADEGLMKEVYELLDGEKEFEICEAELRRIIKLIEDNPNLIPS